MKIKSLIVLLCSAVLIISCSNSTDGRKTLKFSFILGENSDWYRGAKKFQELIEERTHGRFSIKIYPHAQLAGHAQRTELEMVQSGVIDISLESSILLSLIEPRMSVLSMPWLFDDYEQANKILDGALGNELLEMLPEKGLVGLAYGANGFRQITNSKNPINRPEDISALKIRVPAIKMYIDIFKMLGADPSSMNFGEVPTALAQGTMDGQENPLSVIFSARLYEVQKYLTVWNYSYDPVILCINKKLWDAFTPEEQKVFTECAYEAMRFERELVADGEAAMIDSLTVHGMIINSLDKKAIKAFQNLAEPVYSTMSDEIGADLINEFRDAVREGSDK